MNLSYNHPMAIGEFRQPSHPLTPIDPTSVQLWRVPLTPPQQTITGILRLLSQDEQDRAGRFYFPYLRSRYIAGRAALRILLGDQLSTHPASIRFAYTEHDKPYLPDNPLRFNISHAEDLALIAIAPGREVGVDIEHTRSRIDEEQIARRFFSEAEVADYLAVPADQRQQAFYNCWTRKEAYIKAIGEGLTFPLDQFRVTLVPGAPPRLVDVYTDPSEAARWKLVSVEPGEGFTGALIAEGQDWSLESYDFSFPKRYNDPEPDSLTR